MVASDDGGFAFLGRSHEIFHTLIHADIVQLETGVVTWRGVVQVLAETAKSPLATTLEMVRGAVPVLVTLPGAVAGFQFALALKSNVPASGPATVGVANQLASCAKAGAS